MCDPAVCFGGEPLGNGYWMRANMEEGNRAISIYASRDDTDPLLKLDKDMIERLSATAAFLYGPLRAREKVLLMRIKDLKDQLGNIGCAGMSVRQEFGERG